MQGFTLEGEQVEYIPLDFSPAQYASQWQPAVPVEQLVAAQQAEAPPPVLSIEEVLAAARREKKRIRDERLTMRQLVEQGTGQAVPSRYLGDLTPAEIQQIEREHFTYYEREADDKFEKAQRRVKKLKKKVREQGE